MDFGGFGEFGDGALWSRIGMALLCGGMIGLERQLRGKPAGMRTSSLICLGTSMFVFLGMGLHHEVGEGGDATRVLGQIVTGVGFLGAGVIMTRNGLVTGVTSAAVVWVLASAGAAVGAGRFGVALVLSIVTVSVLVGVQWLERMFAQLRRGVHADAVNQGPVDSEQPDDEHRHHHRSRSSGAPPYRPRR
jgi:putative Mg2+ transporter-C (MgtC) family protein